LSTITTYPFTTAGNYTASDSDEIEVSGGVGTLKNIYPTETAYASFASVTTLDRGSGTLTASILNGTPVIDGDGLDIGTGDVISYPMLNNANPSAMTIRFGFIPQYTGFGEDRAILDINGNANINRMLFKHTATGAFSFQVYDEGQAQKSTYSAGSVSFTSGVEVTIEINWDSATGDAYAFLDGTLIASVNSTAFTAASYVSGHRLSIGHSGSTKAYKFTWLQITNTAANLTTHTAEVDPSNVLYINADSASLLTNSSVSGNVMSFAATEVVSGSNLVKYVIQVNGTDKYWDGSAWSTSTGYAQSNTQAEINTNVAMLDTGNSAVKFKVYLYSADGTTTPTVDDLTVSYDAADTSATEPTFCYLEGYLYDFNGPVSGQLVEVRPVLGFANSEIFVSHDWQTFDTTASDGYFSGRIWESASVSGTWEFRFGTKKYRISVPNSTSAKFTDQTITAVTSE